jgi:hypothetical protein
MNMTKLSFLAIALGVASCTAFAPPSVAFSRHVAVRSLVRIFQEKEDATASGPEAVFVSPEEGEDSTEASLETVESLGRGAAKVNTYITVAFESFTTYRHDDSHPTSLFTTSAISTGETR